MWLHVSDGVYQTLPLYSNLGTTGTYVYGKDFDIPAREATVAVETQVRNESDKAVSERLKVEIEDPDGKVVARFEGEPVSIRPGETAVLKAEKRVGGLHFWSWGYGYLYKVKTTVGKDEVVTTTGFRKTEFKDGMISLNDRVIMMHGYAQRSTNEWPGVGMCVPPWLSDYSNDLFVKSGGNSGGAKIVFSDTQTHGRSRDFRVSGVVDPMRIPKDAFFAHQVMWDCWVDDLKPRTYICGHWNYNPGDTVPVVYVVSTSQDVRLCQGDKIIEPDSRDYRFLSTFRNVPYTAGTLTAIGYDKNGKEESRYSVETSGTPAQLKLTPITNPTGWKADGADVALVEIEVVDKAGRRCPLADDLVTYSLDGPAEWRGGVALGKENCVLSDTLRVECGVSRVMLRSLPIAGKITLTASADGLGNEKVELTTLPVKSDSGLSAYIPSAGLKGVLDRGETPADPSFRPWRKEIAIKSVKAPGEKDVRMSCDANEASCWESPARLDSAWITYTLVEKTAIDDVCLKLKGFRGTSCPLAVYADGVKVWEGWTPKSLSYVHLPLKNAPASSEYTIKCSAKALQRTHLPTSVSLTPATTKNCRPAKAPHSRFLKSNS